MNKMNNLEELGKRATEAKYILQALSAERKNEALQAVAKAFLARKQEIDRKSTRLNSSHRN